MTNKGNNKAYSEIEKQLLEQINLVEELSKKLAISEQYSKELAKTLTETEKKAEESDKLKTAFLANLSHEIRTPLNAILGFGEIVCREDIPSNKKNTYFDLIKYNITHLLTLVEELVDYSKMKAGSLVILPAKFSLQKFIDKNRVSVEKFISQLQKENELKNPTIEFSNNSSHSNFMADEIRIQQIVSNLVKNAIKFSENKGNNSHILVDFSWDDKKNTLCIKVQDNGIGINPDKHDIIFEPFRQVDEKITRNYGGTGLGLSIVKSLTDLMHGTITIDSTVGEGTTFTVELPLEPITD